MRIADDFGNWLAGYLDGEATFNAVVYQPQGRTAHNINISMAVGARADDYPLLSYCREQTGLGQLYPRPAQGKDSEHSRSNPCWIWKVASKADCAALVELLTQYPLRSRKRKDFNVWCKIVHEASKRQPSVARRDGGGSISVNDPTRIEELIDELKAGREYDDQYESAESFVADLTTTERHGTLVA